MNETKAPWGVILLGHGSQRGASPRECSCAWQQPTAEEGSQLNGGGSVADLPGWPVWCRRCPNTPQGLGEVARRLQDRLGEEQASVLLSCLEFIEPFPDEAVKLLSRQGVNRVIMLPYLLGHGKHATIEMDEMLDDVRAQSPQVELLLADGLGADPRLADLIVERIGNMGQAAPEPRDGAPVGILLVKAGTRTQYDDCLWLAELGRMVESRMGGGYAVDVAQSHYGDPTMEFAAARLVEERGVKSIICAPYIFFPGLILTRNVLGTLAQLRETYPSVSMTVAPPLGVDDRLIDVAADRVREVWGKG
ncbi:MAG: sirohydrochlorin chelatase [Chloroflexota bacterium]|nr:sirohydrochlorin chelatase [Chloroflexota bacterium]